MKKSVRLTALSLIIASLAALLCSCGKTATTKESEFVPEPPSEDTAFETSESEEKGVKITSIKLGKNGVTISAGMSIEIGYTVIPASADRSLLVWSSDDPTVATVDENGTVTAVANGTTNVNLSTADGSCKAVCKVVVSDDVGPTVVPVSGVKFSREYLVVKEGESERISAVVSPYNATDKAITYSVLDAELAAVGKDGTVQGLKAGVTTLYAGAGEKTCECPLVVLNTDGTLPEKGKIKAEVMAGKTLDLMTVAGYCKGIKGMKYYSDNTNITLKNNVVTGISEGSATVSVVTDQEDLFCEILLTVTKNTDPQPAVTGVKVDQKSIELHVGETAKVTATVQGSNPGVVKVEWIREKNVDTGAYVYSLSPDGTIMATEPGWAYVTAYIKYDGKSHTSVCKVTVLPKEE